MSSMNDEFQFIHSSTLKGNPRNNPCLYETELSEPIDLPGEWNVALINIFYPHNWDNLDKSYLYFSLRLNNPDEVKSEFAPQAIYD